MTESDVIDTDVVSAEVVPFRRPNLPDLRIAATDSWTSVVEEVGTLAARIGDTEFVPRELRGNGAAVAACILAGREVGMAPMTALQTINVIHGKPAISAEGMRGLVLQAGHAIQVTEKTASRVIIRGRRRGDNEWSSVTWTVDDARRAGLGGDNWKKYPRQMLTARATTELCRDLFSDVIHGLRSVEEMIDELDQPTPLPLPPEPTTTVRRRPGRPRKTAAPEPAPCSCGQPTTPGIVHRSDGPCYLDQNTAPDDQKPPAEATPEPPAPTTRKRAPMPAKRAPANPPEPTIEQRQEEIRRLSEERRQLLNPEQPTGDKPQTPADPVTVSGRSKPPTLTAGQRASIMMHFARLDMATDRDERLWWTNRLLGLDPGTIDSAKELTQEQAQTLLGALERYKDRDSLESILQPTLTDEEEPPT